MGVGGGVQGGGRGVGVHMWPGLVSTGGCGAQNKRKLLEEPLVAGELMDTLQQPTAPPHLGPREADGSLLGHSCGGPHLHTQNPKPLTPQTPLFLGFQEDPKGMGDRAIESYCCAPGRGLLEIKPCSTSPVLQPRAGKRGGQLQGGPLQGSRPEGGGSPRRSQPPLELPPPGAWKPRLDLLC